MSKQHISSRFLAPHISRMQEMTINSRSEVKHTLRTKGVFHSVYQRTAQIGNAHPPAHISRGRAPKPSLQLDLDRWFNIFPLLNSTYLEWECYEIDYH